MKPYPITLEEDRYLVSQLNQSDDRIATKALQGFCEQLRRGGYSVNPIKIKSAVLLCLYRPSASLKRWAINALAKIGAPSDIPSVIQAWLNCPDDPDVLSAVVATVFALTDDERACEVLRRADIPLEGLSLIAASQSSAIQKRRLVETIIPLETANAAELRSAIVLAGTGKAPEHLFDKRYTNAIALSQLNKHDVSSVSKYSIWALAELQLGFSSLILPENDIESYPPEVRKWILRLLFNDSYALKRRIEFIELARLDSSAEVREEGAIALKNTFVNGMENPVVQWHFQEQHEEARFRVLEHMAAQSDRATSYSDIVKEIYSREPMKSDRRGRIEAAAIKTALYTDLRMLDISQETGSLFANDNFQVRGSSMVKIEQNFSNNTIGAVTGHSNIITQTMQSISGVENSEIRVLLEQITSELQHSGNKPGVGELAEIVQQTAERPSKSMLQRLVDGLKATKTGMSATASIFKDVDGLIEHAEKLTDLF